MFYTGVVYWIVFSTGFLAYVSKLNISNQLKAGTICKYLRRQSAAGDSKCLSSVAHSLQKAETS